MSSLLPNDKPKMSQAEVAALLLEYDVTDPLCLVGIRGYYKNTMGAPGRNDRGMYDDAMFLWSADTFASFNGNTDPSAYRKGIGRGSRKGMASLKHGHYHSHKIGLHRGKYTALVQTAGPVVVVRDGDPPYEDEGYFGINIHKGGITQTSSLGCQTIPPNQWDAFISLVKLLMKRHELSVMPYLLVEN